MEGLPFAAVGRGCIMLNRVLRSLRRRRAAGARRRSASARPLLREALETRLALSAAAATAPVAMISATTSDSRSVTIEYQVGASSGLVRFGVYRSADDRLDSSDVLLGVWDQGAATPGTHRLTIPVEGGLPIDPARPNVLVVANPDEPGAAADPDRTASFRKYSIGVVSHGGLVHSAWKIAPPWALQTAKLMEWEGYDAVIPFNWTTDSRHPGRAAKQGPRLANQINKIVDKLPDSAVVDLHLIGHSEGAVVNTMALVNLQQTAAPALRAGYVKDTLLDPHAASNDVPGQMSAANNLIGSIAYSMTRDFQGKAKDPTVYIPSNVDEAEVFYQHTKASDAHGVNGNNYNLWGQVPVPNQSGRPVHYYNLTNAGAIHSGAYGVQSWYRNFVATTLSEQAPLIQTLRLEGGLEGGEPTAPSGRLEERRLANWGPDMLIDGAQPSFSGTAAPGSTMRLYVGPTADLKQIHLMTTADADAQGNWRMTTPNPLPRGRYRAVVMAYAPELRTRPALAIVPMAPMGRFIVGPDRNA